MPEQILICAAFVVVLFLSVPCSGCRKLILELSTWLLRLTVFGLLAGGAVLWFRPDLLPVEVVEVVQDSRLLRDMLPETGSQFFGLAAAALLTAILLPLLAAFDVTRKLAGWRVRTLTDEANPPVAAGETGVAYYRLPSDRRGAAETMSQVGSRKPYRVADHVSS